MNHEVPFPVVVANSKSTLGNQSTAMTADGDVIPLTNVVYEFNPCLSIIFSGQSQYR